MSSANPTIDPATLEALIHQVRGVLASRIVLGEDRQIDEIHVVGSPDRGAKQIVRDIESALFVRGGIRVNHKKISLVQLTETAIRPPIERVRLVTIAQTQDAGRHSSSVTLAFNEREVFGAHSAGENDSVGAAESAALATLSAIEQLMKVPSYLVLEHIQAQMLGRLQICLALVTRAEDDSTESMIGVSIVRNDQLAASVRAVLDAVNRRLPYLMGRES